MKPLLLQALYNEQIPRPPVWMMRQAGRYLHEYQAIKAKYGFLQMCKTPDLAFEISMQPVRIFDVDAAIVFADILLPAETMGFNISFKPGPFVENTIKDINDLNFLSTKVHNFSLKYLAETISMLKTELTKSATNPKAVIGFAGAPYTLACYLIEQGKWKHFHGTQVFANQQQSAFEKLMDVITAVTIDYLLLQIEAGADVVQLFDTWGGNLTLEDYRKLSLPYLQRIITEIKKKNCPIILYVNNSSHLNEILNDSGADCLSIDSRCNLEELMKNSEIALQGNFDPTHLFLSKEQVIAETTKMLTQTKNKNNYIANLGHGILVNTPRENVKAFVDTVLNFKR